jgi:hypothetical protein
MKKILFYLLTLVLLNYSYAQPPTITSFSPTSGSVGSLVTITGTNLSNPTAITIGGVSALPISNTGTSLVAMVMSGSVTGKIKITTANGSDSTNNNFTVVASLPPNTQQGNKLVGTGSIGQANQGYAVRVSADGNTAIIGGYFDNSGKGAAWIYTRTAGTWSQQGNKLIGTGGIGTSVYQGGSVDISADGNTVIIGAPKDDGNIGAAWIFIRSNGIWVQQGGKLIGSGATGAQVFQGESVGISADGNTVVVGGKFDNNGVGATWVFTRSNGVWTQEGNKLTGSGYTGSPEQGSSVSLSGDGNTCVIGGSVDNNYQGAIWIFTRSNGIWSQLGNKIIQTDVIEPYVQFGKSVVISKDGNTIMAAGNANSQGAGAAWLYKKESNIWTLQFNKLVGIGGGVSVALSADGNTALMGSTADDNSQGATYVLIRNANTWIQQTPKLIGTGYVGIAQQGVSVAISANGNTAIVGGPADNSNQGAAWIFTNSSSLPVNIISFKAYQKNTTIQLEWNTQNGINLDSYEVEKSIDGSNFTKAWVLIAKGLSAYNWFDASPTNGSNYYRLKMIDKDGSFKYSSIVNVKIGGIKNVFTVAGNPIKNKTLILQMENVEKGNYTISIYNSIGQQMMTKTIGHEGGSATQTFYLSKFYKGTYQLSILGNNLKVTKMLLVE